MARQRGSQFARPDTSGFRGAAELTVEAGRAEAAGKAALGAGIGNALAGVGAGLGAKRDREESRSRFEAELAMRQAGLDLQREGQAFDQQMSAQRLAADLERTEQAKMLANIGLLNQEYEKATDDFGRLLSLQSSGLVPPDDPDFAKQLSQAQQRSLQAGQAVTGAVKTVTGADLRDVAPESRAALMEVIARAAANPEVGARIGSPEEIAASIEGLKARLSGEKDPVIRTALTAKLAKLTQAGARAGHVQGLQQKEAAASSLATFAKTVRDPEARQAAAQIALDGVQRIRAGKPGDATSIMQQARMEISKVLEQTRQEAAVRRAEEKEAKAEARRQGERRIDSAKDERDDMRRRRQDAEAEQRRAGSEQRSESRYTEAERQKVQGIWSDTEKEVEEALKKAAAGDGLSFDGAGAGPTQEEIDAEVWSRLQQRLTPAQRRMFEEMLGA